jgi:hypothetical protein
MAHLLLHIAYERFGGVAHLQQWQRDNALRNPKTDKVLKLSLAVHQAMGEIGNSLSRWCSLLIATFDMLVEVASGFICARTGYIVYDLATTVYQVSFKWRKKKKDHPLGFFA